MAASASAVIESEEKYTSHSIDKHNYWNRCYSSYNHYDLDTIDDDIILEMQQDDVDGIFITPNPFNNKRINYFYGHLDNLYPGIEHIYVDSIDFIDPLHNLPITIRTIHLICSRYDSPLINIPPELEVLILECDNFNQEITELPDTIYEFKIDSTRFEQSLYNLPHYLESFYIRSCVKRYTRDMLPELPYCKDIEIWYKDERVF